MVYALIRGYSMPVFAALSGRGGVSSQIHLATLMGIKVLEDGGNAFDAAITVSSILSVLLPNTGGIGGDGFLLALNGNGEIIAYNGSGRSPREFPVEEYLAENPVRGPLTVTVPGLVDLWGWMNENYGSIDLGLLLRKARSLAMNGFYVQEPLAQAVTSNMESLSEYDGWNRVFGGLKMGSFIRFPKLAKVLGSISRRGIDAFYRSSLTEVIVEELRGQGVPITYEDFAEHKGEEVTPIRCNYKDYELYELPPNTQGISTLQLLKAVEASGISRLPLNSHERITRFFNLAVKVYEDRDRYVADPEYYQTPIKHLLSTEYLIERLRGDLSDGGMLNRNDTTFFVTADDKGNLVGFIQSIFYNFGSGIVAYEIPFQSRGAGFAGDPSLPNRPERGKRPLHTLSILLARHKNNDYMIGCAGGDLRPQIHAEVFINIADYGMSLSRAVDAPRYILTSWSKGSKEAIVEGDIGGEDMPGWITRIGQQSPRTGIVHAALRRSDGVYMFVADPRGGGSAAPLL